MMYALPLYIVSKTIGFLHEVERILDHLVYRPLWEREHAWDTVVVERRDGLSDIVHDPDHFENPEDREVDKMRLLVALEGDGQHLCSSCFNDSKKELMPY